MFKLVFDIIALESEAMDISICDIDEVGSDLVQNVVVADNLVAAKLVDLFVSLCIVES